MGDINKKTAKAYRRTKRADAKSDFKYRGGAPEGKSYIGGVGRTYIPARENTVTGVGATATSNLRSFRQVYGIKPAPKGGPRRKK